MSKTKIKLVQANVSSEILKGEEVKEYCEKVAEGVASKAGVGYETNTFTGKHRINVSVAPVTPEAKRDNYKHNTLLKAVST
jgi:hypothetical protein